MPASNQASVKTKFTLFPSYLALVPYDLIAGLNPTIKSLADINDTNSIVFNEMGSEGKSYIINENGIDVTKTKSSVAIRALLKTGLGDVDDVTNDRTLEVMINCNGFSNQLEAILDGGNPFTDINSNQMLSKNELRGAISSIVLSTDPSHGDGDAIVDGVYSLVVDNTGTGGTGFEGTVTIASNRITAVTITNEGSGYSVAPAVTVDAALTFAEPQPSFNITVGSGVASGGYAPSERIEKQKWFMLIKTETGDVNEGDIYTIIPKLIVKDQDVTLDSRKSEKIDTIIPLKGLLILNSEELTRLKQIYSGINSSDLYFSFNAADVTYTEA